MTSHDRFKLLFGPYRTPRFKYGDLVFCELRGWVKITGLTDGRIPWPTCRVGKRKARALILYGALGEAVRRESAQAVGYWWGVAPCTVSMWRQALDVKPTNEGTRRLRHDYALEPGV